MARDHPADSSRPPAPVERVRGSRPDDEAWRADALAGSRHSRWVDELRQPLDLQDQDRAEAICAQVSRMVLQDFAPALLLLTGLDRRRLQAITAYALTLLDFARQSGLEGERLTAINRWDFELEAALDGQPMGQPIFVVLAALEQRRPWPREGFDHLHAYARRRCALLRPPNREVAERDSLALGKSLTCLVLGDEPSEPVAQFGAALVRLRGLLDLGDDLRRHRARLPVTEIPDHWSPDHTADPQVLKVAILEECRRLDSLFEQQSFRTQLPPDLRPAARYCQRTGQNLLSQIQSAATGIVDEAPRIGLIARLWLLARSRWF